MTTTLTVRLDDELKRQFTEVVESVGLDVPTVVRMLATQTVRDRAIPLSLRSNRATPAEQSEQETMRFLDATRADWGQW
jgi:DNA-damage-inducible protein J